MDPDILDVLNDAPITSIAKESLDLRRKTSMLPGSEDYQDLLLQISELKGAVEKLTRENDWLADDNEDLQVQLSQSKDIANRYLEALEVVNSGRKTFRHLPNEILHLIFLRTVAPYSMLDPSLAGGPASPWFKALRMRKSIVMVCRQWNIVGTELLYEKAVFHRIGQISALAHTLEHNVSLGNLIKSIDIRCFVPPGYISLVKNDLRFIFDQCSRILQLALNEFQSPIHNTPPRRAWIHSTLSGPYLSRDLSGVLSRLTHLECSDVVEFGDLVLMLQVCNELRSLIFYLSNDGPDLSPDPRYHLHLDCLISLRFTVKSRTSHLLTIPALWFMPNLRHLSIYHYDNEPNSDFPERYCQPLFEKYGRTLKYLHIRRIVSNAVGFFDMEQLLRSCPLLEHLVLGPDIECTTPVTYPSIMWIDLWGSATLVNRPLFTLATFPALRGVRELDRALSDAVEWPLVLPPNPDIDDLVFEYPGLHIQDSTRGIYKKDNNHNADGISTIYHFDGDDSDDESFRPPKDTGSNGSGSDGNWTSDEDDACDMEEVNETEDWVDREMALAVFHQIQE